jgi:hypothetical protein
MFLLNTGGVMTHLFVEETDALTDRPRRFERKSGFTQSFKKLRIKSCVDGSLHYQEISYQDNFNTP